MKTATSGKKLLRNILLLVLLMALMATGIYAWIYGDSAPSVTGSMKIGDTSGLVFEIDSAQTQLIDLNSHLGLSTANMVLNEVSSADGVTFLKRNTGQYFQESGNPDGNEEIITLSAATPDYLDSTGEDGPRFNGDYLHADFNLMLEYAEPNAKYYIYFLDGTLGTLSGFRTGFSGKQDSMITEDGLRALRASLTVNGAKEYGPVLDANHRIILGNAAETAENGFTKAVISTEKVSLKQVGIDQASPVEIAGHYYIDGTPKDYGTLTPGMNVHSFKSCAIDGKDGLTGAVIPNENYLVVLDGDCKNVSLSLNLWLEGGSEFCRNADVYINDNVDFNMYLVAYKVYEE